MNKSEIFNQRRPVKPRRHINIKAKLKYVWSWLLVKLGKRVWARPVYSRPRFQVCPFHNTNMKRGRKTPNGAFYYCPKCKKYYHLNGGGMKLVQVKKKGKN
jgi:hypothetical protein